MSASSLPHASIGPRFVAAVAIATAACSANTVDPPSTKTESSTAAIATVEYDTFIGSGKYLEIDQAGTLLAGADANLFTGLDPADSSASYAKPCNLTPALCAEKTWIDWNDLPVANHQLLDVDDPDGRDPTAFPRSDACVGAANVVTKMNLGYVGVASNNAYVYLDVMRRSNLGDAGYVWLFTKKIPPFDADASCHPGEKLLRFDISVGDVMVFGHYKTGGGPLLRVFKANSSGLFDAVSAINFDNASLWTEDSSGIAGVAVNTTKTRPGSWGTGGAGKSALVGGEFDTELFAEAAVTTATFASGGSTCGQTFYAAVVTRSSGSGGTSPDVKDLAGPAKFNFGSVRAEATATPTCTGTVALTGTAYNGSTPVTATCKWYDVVGTTETEISSECSPTITLGTTALPYGEHTFRLKVTDPDGCNATAADVHAAAWPAPIATADLTGTCTNTIDYVGGSSGVIGTAAYAWTFTHGDPPITDSTSTTQSSSISVVAGTTYTGKLVVTDTRTDGKGGTLACESAPVSDTALARGPITLELSASANPIACAPSNPNAAIDDAVTFTATAGGGDGAYVYTWTIDGSVEATCTGATCTINPPDSATCARHTIEVAVDDGNPLCAAKGAGPKVYTKITTVTVTNPE